MNKPNKKTEWERFRDKLADWEVHCGWQFDWKELEESLKILLHQRDNEIREKIQGMIDSELSAKPADDMEKTAEWYKVSALKDLLTYLSNKEEPIK